MQAPDVNEEVIPGLYVTGQDMEGLYDSTYDLLAEGSASSFALRSGHIAIEHFVLVAGHQDNRFSENVI